MTREIFRSAPGDRADLTFTKREPQVLSREPERAFIQQGFIGKWPRPGRIQIREIFVCSIFRTPARAARSIAEDRENLVQRRSDDSPPTPRIHFVIEKQLTQRCFAFVREEQFEVALIPHRQLPMGIRLVNLRPGGFQNAHGLGSQHARTNTAPGSRSGEFDVQIGGFSHGARCWPRQAEARAECKIRRPPRLTLEIVEPLRVYLQR
jgi:hypothetical protein